MGNVFSSSNGVDFGTNVKRVMLLSVSENKAVTFICTVFTRDSMYNASRVLAIATRRPSVCPSVRPSVCHTPVLCQLNAS